jgi:recombination protein RecR
MYSPTIQKLIELFSKFPTVGPRTAARFVFYLTRLPKEKVDELLKAIEELKTKIKICPLCFNSFEGTEELCPICQDPRRDKNIICLVEKEVDLEAIEKTGKFKGLYFVLGGTISGLEKEKEKERIEERVEKLENRIKENSEIKELILALNPTTEGQSTALWLQRKLKNLGIKITQLGRGLPVGGELEYADEETLSSALESRK